MVMRVRGKTVRSVLILREIKHKLKGYKFKYRIEADKKLHESAVHSVPTGVKIGQMLFEIKNH